MKKVQIIVVIVLLVSFLLSSSSATAQNADKIGNLFEKLSWRCVGPAVVGGRAVDIEAVEEKPWIIYAAIGPSGVWKSENNGITWEAVFEKEKTVSVGDVAISPSHPEIVWVGSGEATCRNSVTIGDGVYKSENGGKTWQKMGLEETRHISRIVVNPGDPNIVFVAAMGHLWGPNKERGIYRRPLTAEKPGRRSSTLTRTQDLLIWPWIQKTLSSFMLLPTSTVGFHIIFRAEGQEADSINPQTEENPAFSQWMERNLKKKPSFILTPVSHLLNRSGKLNRRH